MSDAKPPAPRSHNVVPMLRRLGKAVKLIFGLVDSVAQLKLKNEALSRKIDELRHEVDQQAGQVRVLLQFVQSALNDRVQEQARAAVRAVLAERENQPGTKRPARKKRTIRQAGSKSR